MRLIMKHIVNKFDPSTNSSSLYDLEWQTDMTLQAVQEYICLVAIPSAVSTALLPYVPT